MGQAGQEASMANSEAPAAVKPTSVWFPGGSPGARLERMCGSRVLVVEDDVACREALVSSLSAEGFAVSEACDGIEALSSLGKPSLPDVILLDLRLPQIDGWTFLERMREHPRLAHIPVVALSGSAFGAASADAFQAFLPKPFDLLELKETLERVTARS